LSTEETNRFEGAEEMLNALIGHSTVLAITIIVMALLNYGLVMWSLRKESHQSVFVRPDVSQPITSLQQGAHQALPFTAAVPLAAVTLFLDGYPREALSGGFLVMQVASLILNVETLLRLQIATINGICDGRIILSTGYQYRTLASRIVVLAVFSEIVAASFGNLSFATGGSFLFASAVGYYRRAIRVSTDKSFAAHA
jgi:hypothetical protein